MTDTTFRERLAYPAFVHALHVPGLELDRAATDIAGLPLRRLSWVEWLALEHTATAEALMREFEEGLHSFVFIDRLDFRGDETAAWDLALDDAARLSRLVTALRIVKPGDLLDPAGSMRYQRRGSNNFRTPGRFGRRLFEQEHARKYVLRDEDVALAEALAAHLAQSDVAEDRTIQLAVRHFDASYDHAIDIEERLLHVFTSLEATFGEYKRQARPVAGVSLGKTAAALWPPAARGGIANFLDDKDQARGLRNAVAHGDVGGKTPTQLDAAIERLREVLRMGLRHLLRLSARRAALATRLERVSTGLVTLPAKAAFQHVLGHAAKGSAEAKALLAGLFG